MEGASQRLGWVELVLRLDPSAVPEGPFDVVDRTSQGRGFLRQTKTEGHLLVGAQRLSPEVVQVVPNHEKETEVAWNISKRPQAFIKDMQ